MHACETCIGIVTLAIDLLEVAVDERVMANQTDAAANGPGVLGQLLADEFEAGEDAGIASGFAAVEPAAFGVAGAVHQLAQGRGNRLRGPAGFDAAADCLSDEDLLFLDTESNSIMVNLKVR